MPLYYFPILNEGWGRTKNEGCFTNDNGPNRHDRCRFPFYYNGRQFSSCLKAPSPSKGNKRCQQFKADKGKEAMPKEGKSIKIIYGRGKRSTICYSEGFKVDSNIIILKKEGLLNINK